MHNSNSLLPSPPFKITDGTLEGLKWLALVSMTVDHANRFFLAGSSYSAYCFGRLAMPLFAFILAFNLARPQAWARGLYKQTLGRLAIFGFLAMPAYNAMKGIHSWWPLNIMFTLWLATACLFFIEKRGVFNLIAAALLFFFCGPLVEYNWPGLGFCLSAWAFCKKPSIITFATLVIFCLLLKSVNYNNWALAALPLIFMGTQLNLQVPRIRYLFYIYYPGHLWLFWVLRALLKV